MNEDVQNSELRQRILRDLKDVGFSLEIRCSAILVSNDWRVLNQVSFADPESTKLRSVDIVAKRFKLDREPDKWVELYLVVECKKSSKPWIFYSPGVDISEIHREHYFPTSKVLKESYSNSKLPLSFHFGNHRVNRKKRGLIPVVAFSGGSSRAIFTAANQVTKSAFSSFVRRDTQLKQIFKKRKESGILVVHPIIVLEGNLFSSTLLKSGDLDATEANWIVYDCPISFGSERIPENRLLVDVVTIDFLDQYILLMGEEFDETCILNH